MKLRGIEFGDVFVGSGTLNFFGGGYPFHKLWRVFGMDYSGATFTAKTTTFEARQGNMPLRDDGYTPREFFPRCITAKPMSGHVLNAVGLSGPGAEFLLETGLWQERTEPFCLSFMAIGPTREERLGELGGFVDLLMKHLPRFRAPVALVINYGCPNVGFHIEDVIGELRESAEIAKRLNIPLIANFSPVAPIEILEEASRFFDALWIGNTIPWGYPGIDWKRLFGSDESPLVARGFSSGGGLSGPACLPFVIEKVRMARGAGIIVPIIAGNGIQRMIDARQVVEAGANAIAIGIVGIVRPRRTKRIIRAGKELLKGGMADD